MAGTIYYSPGQEPEQTEEASKKEWAMTSTRRRILEEKEKEETAEASPTDNHENLMTTDNSDPNRQLPLFEASKVYQFAVDSIENKSQHQIAQQCVELARFLIRKNRKYGNSAFKPVRIFSTASPVEQLNVRIDDKLSRILKAPNDEDEDVELDLIGYLVLRRIARKITPPHHLQETNKT